MNQKPAPVTPSLSSNLVIKAQERRYCPYVSKKNRGNIWGFCRSSCRNLSESLFLYITPFFNHKITFNHVYTAEPAWLQQSKLLAWSGSVWDVSASPQQPLQGCALCWQWKGLVAQQCSAGTMASEMSLQRSAPFLQQAGGGQGVERGHSQGSWPVLTQGSIP